MLNIYDLHEDPCVYFYKPSEYSYNYDSNFEEEIDLTFLDGINRNNRIFSRHWRNERKKLFPYLNNINKDGHRVISGKLLYNYVVLDMNKKYFKLPGNYTAIFTAKNQIIGFFKKYADKKSETAQVILRMMLDDWEEGMVAIWVH